MSVVQWLPLGTPIAESDWCRIRGGFHTAINSNYSSGLASALATLMTLGLFSPASLANDATNQMRKCPDAIPRLPDDSIDWKTFNCVADYWASQKNESKSANPCPWFQQLIPLACVKPEYEKVPDCEPEPATSKPWTMNWSGLGLGMVVIMGLVFVIVQVARKT